MSLWFSAVMGLIQGLTEFIPVSSSAHLRLAPALFHQPDPGAAFTAVIQFGTLAAVIVYFARDLFVDLPRAMFKEPGSPNGRLPYLLVLATLPIVLGGLLLKHHIEGNFRSLYVVATTMTVVERRTSHWPCANLRAGPWRVALGSHDLHGADARHAPQ